MLNRKTIFFSATLCGLYVSTSTKTNENMHFSYSPLSTWYGIYGMHQMPSWVAFVLGRVFSGTRHGARICTGASQQPRPLCSNYSTCRALLLFGSRNYWRLRWPFQSTLRTHSYGHAPYIKRRFLALTAQYCLAVEISKNCIFSETISTNFSAYVAEQFSCWQ